MSDFLNTIDVLGDEAVVTSIVDRSITEFKDDVLTKLGKYAFHNCKSLTAVDLPNVTDFGDYAFQDCSALVSVNFPKLIWLNGWSKFAGCTSLKEVCFPLVEKTGSFHTFSSSGIQRAVFPSLKTLGAYTFNYCNSLRYVDCGSQEAVTISAGGGNFTSSGSFDTLIVRSSTVSNLDGNAFKDTKIGKGTGYIYVPRALIDSYKAATNWSTYADQFRALEDYTVDKTTTGELRINSVSYILSGSVSSNTSAECGNTYYTVLSSIDTNPVSDVVVTMGGVDVTASVYNAETGEISIPLVTGAISIFDNVEYDGQHLLLYKLPQATTFNGTSDYVDTGIKLFDTPKDFSIICVADFTAVNNGGQEFLFHCMNEVTPYPGLSVDCDNNGSIRAWYTGAASISSTIVNKNNITALAFSYKAGVLNAVRYKNTAGEIVTFNHNTATKYTAITQNLILGAYQNTSGTKGRYYNGTISVFRVYAEALEDDEIVAKLQEL